MNKTFRKLLSLTLCLIMVLGTVAVGSDGLSELFDKFAVKANAEETGYKAGDSIYFGKYPQSKVSDSALITALKDLTPDSFRDVEYEGEKYRLFQSSYYKYEPIEWKVLDTATGLCVSNYSLYPMYYGNSNDYVSSSTRKWLYGGDGTGEFYTCAFTDTEKSAIDSRLSTTYKYNSTEVASIVGDRVFLLSVEEASNTYFFANDEDRICYPTDYCYAIIPCENWWLRSPGANSSSAAYVNDTGGISAYGTTVNVIRCSVRPALYLNLKSEIFKSEITLDANNGTGNTTIKTANKFIEYYPECPFKNKGYSFNGWFTDKQCTEKWTETDIVNEDITLYAGWKANAPKVKITENNVWVVSYDNGTTWETLYAYATGDDGVGIASTSINDNGELIIKLTNGNESNLGKVTGNDGTNGIDGKDGENGITPQLKVGDDGFWYVSYDNGTNWNPLYVKATGENGTNGINGEKGDKGDTGAQGEAGKDGKDATTIVSSHYNEKGELILVMSDGTEINSGNPIRQTLTLFMQRIINFFKSIFAVINSWF